MAVKKGKSPAANEHLLEAAACGTVLKELERCFEKDRVRTVIHGLTSLGLVEMTRRRSRPPLREVMKKETGTMPDKE